MKKLKMKLKVQSIYGVSRLYPKCEKSEGLFELIRPKMHLEMLDLPSIKKMGFIVELEGDSHPFVAQAKATNTPVEFEIQNGKIANLIYKG